MRWNTGSNGFQYKKSIITKNRWFDICVLKILTNGYINGHVDEGKQLRININLPNRHSGGEFECINAYFNCCGISLYEASTHRHRFKKVIFGTKYIISFGIYL